MVKRITRSGGIRGGIISLVRIIEKHDRALEYDLMTRTGRTLSEYLSMGAAGKVALLSFINFLPPDSMLNRAMNPKDEFGEWNTQMKTNVILADLFDAFASAHTKKGRKAPEYPRPKKKMGVGKDPIPISQFDVWWNKGR